MTEKTGPRLLTSTLKCLKTLQVLSISGSEMTLAEVSSAAKQSRPTTYQHLQTLAAAELVEQTRKGGYRLSLNVLELSMAATTQHGVGPEVASEVASLAAKSGEATTLAVREGEYVIMVHRATIDNAIRMPLGPGSKMPLNRSASGSVLLAYDDTIAGSEYVDSEVLKLIRQQGFVVSVDEFLAGLTTIAVPVNMPGGRLGALSIAAPTIRFDQDRLLALLTASRLQSGT